MKNRDKSVGIDHEGCAIFGKKKRPLNFWLLTKRAFSWFDPNSTPKYYIRWGGVRMVALFFCFIGGWAASGMVQDTKDFDTPYPLEKDLRIDDGWLTEGKGKVTHFLFKFENGAVQRFHPSGVFDYIKTEWFRDESDQPVWRKASIGWFKLPSGSGWLATLELEGKSLAEYEQRRQDFFSHKRIRDLHPASHLLRLASQYLYYLGVGLIALAYLASWFQLRKDVHG